MASYVVAGIMNYLPGPTEADSSNPGCATRQTPTLPSAPPVARIFMVGCHVTRTTSSVWPRHTPCADTPETPRAAAAAASRCSSSSSNSLLFRNGSMRHTRAVSSSPADASSRSSHGQYARSNMRPAWRRGDDSGEDRAAGSASVRRVGRKAPKAPFQKNKFFWRGNFS